MLVSGTTVLLETAPLDPWDLFRLAVPGLRVGDYVTLNYKISTLKPTALGAGEDFRPGQPIHVGIEKRGKYWEAVSISRKPTKGVYLRGRIDNSLTDSLHVVYGIETYFLPEGTARKVESSLLFDEARRGLLSVEVAIGRDSAAVIRKLYIRNTPFP